MMREFTAPTLKLQGITRKMINYKNRKMLQLGVSILVLLQVCNSFAYGQVQSNDFLVCKPIGSLFEMQQSSTGGSSTPIRGSPGPPGRRGPRGLTGPIGPTGPQPSVDWNRIERKIDEKIKGLSQCPGVVFNGSCFWLPQTVASFKHGRGKAAAESLCRFHNGTLVDIESEQMYEALYLYIQRAWNLYVDHPTYSMVEVWLASRYENGELRSSTGGSVYVRWYPGNPSGSGQAVIWTIATNPSRGAYVGMYSLRNVNRQYGVPLCRI